jgi:hypothetical protein
MVDFHGFSILSYVCLPVSKHGLTSAFLGTRLLPLLSRWTLTCWKPPRMPRLAAIAPARVFHRRSQVSGSFWLRWSAVLSKKRFEFASKLTKPAHTHTRIVFSVVLLQKFFKVNGPTDWTSVTAMLITFHRNIDLLWNHHEPSKGSKLSCRSAPSDPFP